MSLNVTLVFKGFSSFCCQYNKSSLPHCRPFWMPCRTRRRPAAPSSVSSGWDSTRPSWWPTRLKSTLGPLRPTHLDTSGPQTGERGGGREWAHLQPDKGFWGTTAAAQCDDPPFSVFFSSGVFEIAEASGVQRGTKIVLHFKDDCKEFSTEDRVKGTTAAAMRRSAGPSLSAPCAHRLLPRLFQRL